MQSLGIQTVPLPQGVIEVLGGRVIWVVMPAVMSLVSTERLHTQKPLLDVSREF